MVFFRTLIVLIALALVSVSSARAQQPLDQLPQVLKPIDSVFSALSSGNTKTVAGVYTPDAIVIDDFGPSRWTGGDAGSEWLSNVTGSFGKFNVAKFTPQHSPSSFMLNGETAYVVIAGVVTSKTKGHPFRNPGAFTFTLRNVSGTWKISSQTWTAPLVNNVDVRSLAGHN